MKYANEVKVGLVIVIAAVAFYVGTQFFRDLPIFSRNAQYGTIVPSAAGLVSGNSVLVNGVTVGSVDGVQVVEGGAKVDFNMRRGIPLTHGTSVAIEGFGALGDLRLEITLGPAESELHREGDTIPNAGNKIVDEVAGGLPETFERVNALVASSDGAVVAARGLMTDPTSDLLLALKSVGATAESLTSLLEEQRSHIRSVLAGFDSLSHSMNALVQDSLAVTVTRLNSVLGDLEDSLASLAGAADAVSTVLGMMATGEGTLGRLMQDDALYVELRSAVSSMNSLLEDFQADPRKYLREMRLVDIF